MIEERWQVWFPEFDKKLDIIIIAPFLHQTAKEVLKTFDLTNIQVGYKLDGTIVTTEEFTPEGAIQLSHAGKARLNLDPRTAGKIADRMRKYSRRLIQPVRVDPDIDKAFPLFYYGNFIYLERECDPDKYIAVKI